MISACAHPVVLLALLPGEVDVAAGAVRHPELLTRLDGRLVHGHLDELDGAHRADVLDEAHLLVGKRGLAVYGCVFHAPLRDLRLALAKFAAVGESLLEALVVTISIGTPTDADTGDDAHHRRNDQHHTEGNQRRLPMTLALIAHVQPP